MDSAIKRQLDMQGPNICYEKYFEIIKNIINIFLCLLKVPVNFRYGLLLPQNTSLTTNRTLGRNGKLMVGIINVCITHS